MNLTFTDEGTEAQKCQCLVQATSNLEEERDWRQQTGDPTNTDVYSSVTISSGVQYRTAELKYNAQLLHRCSLGVSSFCLQFWWQKATRRDDKIPGIAF